MKVVAFVPIKLNNERLPHKNILPLGGRPIFTNGETTIEFFGETSDGKMYRTTQSVKLMPKSQIEIMFEDVISAGTYEMFYAQDYAYSGAGEIRVSVGEGQNRLVFDIPETGWNTLRLDFPNLIGEYKITGISTSDGKSVFTIQAANMAETSRNGDVLHVTVTDPLDPYITFTLE
jgi:hypothetical protein